MKARPALCGQAGPALFLLLLQWVLLAAATVRHTLWRDEAQAWLLARDSTSPLDLLHNLRYEGHPPLWHLILFVLTRFTWNPAWMKAFNFLFAAGTSALVLSESRIPLLLRAGIVFSYFFAFEYGVIARNYMLGVFLLCWATKRFTRQQAPVQTSLLLALAALSSMPALVAGAALFALLFSHLLRELRDSPPSLKPSSRQLWLASLLFCSAATLSVYLMHPPPDSQFFYNKAARAATGSTMYATRYALSRAYFPLLTHTPKFWEGAYDPDTSVHRILSFVAILFLGALAVLFRQTRARWFLVGTTALIALQLHVSGVSAMRHMGWLFVVLVLGLWLEFAGETTQTDSPRRHGVLALAALLLLVQGIAAGFALATSFAHPFSASYAVANYLRARHLSNAPLISEPDYEGTAVLAYLGRRSLYSPEEGKQVSFVEWTHAEHENRHIPSPVEVHAAYGTHDPVVFLTEDPLPQTSTAALHVHLRAAFADSVGHHEQYFVYF